MLNQLVVSCVSCRKAASGGGPNPCDEDNTQTGHCYRGVMAALEGMVAGLVVTCMLLYRQPADDNGWRDKQWWTLARTNLCGDKNPNKGLEEGRRGPTPVVIRTPTRG